MLERGPRPETSGARDFCSFTQNSAEGYTPALDPRRLLAYGRDCVFPFSLHPRASTHTLAFIVKWIIVRPSGSDKPGFNSSTFFPMMDDLGPFAWLLCLSFFICKMSILITLIGLFPGVDEIGQVRHLSQCLPYGKCSEMLAVIIVIVAPKEKPSKTLIQPPTPFTGFPLPSGILVIPHSVLLSICCYDFSSSTFIFLVLSGQN